MYYYYIFLLFRKSLLLFYCVSFSIIISSCCTSRRDIDDFGIPKQAKNIKILTPLQKKGLIDTLKLVLAKRGFSIQSEGSNNFRTSALPLTRSNFFIRYIVNINNSMFIVKVESSSDKNHWKSVVNCGEPGSEAYEIFIELVSQVPTLSIEFDIRKFLWCWILKCKEDSKK